MSVSASFHRVTRVEFEAARHYVAGGGGWLQLYLEVEGQLARSTVTLYSTDPRVVDHFHDIARTLQGPLIQPEPEPKPDSDLAFAADAEWLSEEF